MGKEHFEYKKITDLYFSPKFRKVVLQSKIMEKQQSTPKGITAIRPEHALTETIAQKKYLQPRFKQSSDEPGSDGPFLCYKYLLAVSMPCGNV